MVATVKFAAELKKSLMARALKLAWRGAGRVDPNPMVGAVLALPDGKILAEGWHAAYGADHAEAMALQSLNEVPAEAALFVNLEPCCHNSNTPPCVDILLRKKVQHLVYGTIDPNPLIAGKGIARLKAAGVTVELSAMANQCREFNRIFFHHITKQQTYLALKIATSIDGKIALNNGKSQWITNPASRELTQKLRHFYQGLAVGSKTVQLDNPRLTVTQGLRAPVKVVFSSKADLPPDCRFITSLDKARRILIAGSDVSLANRRQMEKQKIELLQTSTPRPQITEALGALYKAGVFFFNARRRE